MTLTRLPARLPIEEGESIASFVRRLASLNDVAVAYVVGSERQLPKKRPHSDVLERIADLSGVDRSRLEDSTMQGCSGVVLYVQSRWRLRTAIWECSRCKSRGIEDRDRGFAIAFACIRCGTLLGISGSDDTESKQQVELEPSMIELQRELLASFHSTAESPAAAERLDRLSIGANTLGQALSRRGRAADLTQWPAVEGSWRWKRFNDRWLRGALALPECPSLFAEVFKMGWEVAASPYLHLMVQACLGGIAEVKQPQWLPGVTWLQRLQAGSIPGCGSVQALEVCKRMSELRDLHGLRSAHVPNEIRYSEDPLILEGSTASWRRHLCVVLRHWLLRLEGDAPEPDWKAQGYFDSHDHSPISMFAPPQWISSTDAGSLANQILSVAEHLVSRGLSECFELKAGLSENLLEQLIPAVPIRSGAAGLAEFWMWLDEVAGTDAHVRVPERSMSGIKEFDDDLGAEGRLRLREYRIRSAMKVAEISTADGLGRSNVRIETA